MELVDMLKRSAAWDAGYALGADPNSNPRDVPAEHSAYADRFADGWHSRQGYEFQKFIRCNHPDLWAATGLPPF